ncbi:MAG: Lrp/AsnC ligand binding domain-containing protein [Promethearchaeota archaeon]
MSDPKQRKKNQALIKRLNNKTKFNISRISQALGLSRQTIQTKLSNLRDQQIIKNFTININPNIQPNNLKFVMLEIKTNPKEPELVEELLKLPQLRMLDGIFGEFSLIALFIFKSSDEYYQILNEIDKIMSQSYFKKYQIIETIKVFKTNGIKLKNSGFNEQYELDKIDGLILKILQERQGLKPISTYDIKHFINEEYRDIAQKHYKDGISQPTVHNKIKKLEQNNVILNYSVDFCPRKLGFKGKYIVRIKPKDPSKYDILAKRLIEKNQITDLFRIGEQYGLFAIVRVKKIEDYSNFIKDLYDSEEIEDTFTNFVLDELRPFTNFVIF